MRAQFCVLSVVISLTEGLPSWNSGVCSPFSNGFISPIPTKECVSLECYEVRTQGPCGAGQKFYRVTKNIDPVVLFDDALGTKSARKCSDNEFAYWRTDVSKNLGYKTNYGYCLWDDPTHPCNGRPANYRYFNETKRCHPVEFEEYCPTHTSAPMENGHSRPLTKGTFTTSCLLPYPTWGCINHKYYSIGTQGPCDNNQIYLKVPENFNVSLLRGGALGKTCAFNYGETYEQNDYSLNVDFNNTYPPRTNRGQSYGYCVWNDKNHPCNGLPANQRYSNETGRCHTIGFQEYCALNQVFYEERYVSEEIYGSCDCYPLFTMWYDPNDGNCYPPHSQGSCPPGYWLTIKSISGPVECEPAPCPADGKHVYWNSGHQQCYLRGERGPCVDDGYEEVLGHPYGVLTCASFRTTGPSIVSRSPRRHCGREPWQTGSRMSQVSQLCENDRLERISYYGNTSNCGQGIYSRALGRCIAV